MTDELREADFYELEGPGIEITYRRSDGELTITGDELAFSSDNKFVADATVQPELGLVATAVLLPSSRAGLRITLTLVLPEVSLEPGSNAATDLTGAAIITSIFKRVVGGPRPVLQSYDVRPLQGAASSG